MKKLALVIFLLGTVSYLQAQYAISFVRKKGETSCGLATDLCYGWAYDKKLTFELDKKAKAYVNDKCSESGSYLSTSNSSDVSYMVIVESTFTPYGYKCSTKVFAHGGGKSRDAALKDAVKNLGINNWNWSSKFGYTILEEREL